jgi:hypothetical protein
MQIECGPIPTRMSKHASLTSRVIRREFSLRNANVARTLSEFDHAQATCSRTAIPRFSTVSLHPSQPRPTLVPGWVYDEQLGTPQRTCALRRLLRLKKHCRTTRRAQSRVLKVRYVESSKSPRTSGAPAQRPASSTPNSP